MATATLDYPQTLTELPLSPEILTETPAHFIEWLTQKNPNDVVGHACIAYSCPAANWLSSFFVVASVDTGYCEVGNNDGDGMKVFSTPMWMKQFINTVDKMDPTRSYPEVTAQQCLDILTSL